MGKRTCRVPLAMLALWVITCQTTLRSADFIVANRDEVLVLTSRLQATQFLTHATFGPTEQEVNTLAARMRALGTIAAANEWIDTQMNGSTTVPSLQMQNRSR